MKSIDPKSLIILKGLPPRLSKQDKCAIDTEWWGMDKNRLHRPTGQFACATFCSDGRTVYVVTDPNDLAQAFENIKEAVWIFHHAKFDVFHLRRHIKIEQRKKLWCTMLIEQIMFSGLYTDFSLADLTRRHLGIYLEKNVRDEFSK